MWLVWLVIAGVLFVGEILTAGFLLLWFAIAAIVAMLVSFLTTNLFIQILVFVIVSVLLLIFTRPLLSKYAKSDNTVTNSSAIIGKTALVTEEISLLNSTGQINVDGEIWSAKTMDPNLTFPKGSKVEIIGIDGVKACVASNYQIPSNNIENK